MSGTQNNVFRACARDVVLALLGQPNKAMSTRDELRFGSRGSLSIDLKKGVWHDHEAGNGGGVLELVMREKSLGQSDAAAWLRDGGFIPDRERQLKPKPRIAEAYDYVSAEGEVLFRVLRMVPKDFRQQTPDGRGGWKWGAKNARKVLYRLPQVLEAVRAGKTIWIVEGEKSVHALETAGLTATCSPGGAGKWRQEYNAALEGADVVVLPDNDSAGKKHADDIVKALSAVAGRIRILGPVRS